MANLDAQILEVTGESEPGNHPRESGRNSGQYDRDSGTILADTTRCPSLAQRALNSWLYREFQAEREEILKYKWIESEKAGRDIGFEKALTGWVRNERKKWRQTRMSRPGAGD